MLQLHGALVAKNYKIALNYCNASKEIKQKNPFLYLEFVFKNYYLFVVLSYEKHNTTMISFQELLTRKLEISK